MIDPGTHLELAAVIDSALFRKTGGDSRSVAIYGYVAREVGEDPMIPVWLHWLAWIALGIGLISAMAISLDEIFHPQQMWIMDVVWPVTALYAGPLALWAYYRYGRLSTRQKAMEARQRGQEPPGKGKPFAATVALGTTHCGAGCSLGDLCAEWLVFATGVTLWPLPHHKHLFAAWSIDFAFAYVLGIVFQYFTIAPMRGLSVGKGLWAAIKADTLALTAWQIGMYGWMAVVSFLLFHRDLEMTSPVFWFMMQIAMLFGFLTSYPVNWWLLRVGLKEAM
jgi:hypothetical protein